MPTAGYFKRQQGYGRTLSNHLSAQSSLAIKNMKQIKQLKGMLNTELKYRDNADVPTFGNTIIHIADTLPQFSLSQMDAGTSNNQRIGRQVKAKSVQIRLALRHNASGNLSQTVRVMVVRAKVCDGVHPTIGDILLDTTNVRSFRKVSESLDASVLADRSVTFDAERPSKEVNIYLKLNSLVKYLGADASQAHDGHGTLLLYLFSDQATDNFPTYSIQSRFRYVDN